MTGRRLVAACLVLVAVGAGILVTPLPAAAVGVPGVPTITRVSGGESSATVTWRAPANDGGSLVTSYTITASPGGASLKVNMPYLVGTVTDLKDGTAYRFTVKATNAAGSGAASRPSASVTPSHPGAQFTALATYRICDTRSGNPSSLAGTDAQCNGASDSGTTAGPGTQFHVKVAGTNPSGASTGGVPATGATSVLLSVTALNTTTAGSLTVWETSTKRPSVPGLEWASGAIDTEQVAVPLAKAGEVSVYNATGKTDVLVDVLGYDAPSRSSNAGLFVPLPPYRVCDTRPGNPSGLTGTDAGCEGRTLGAGATLGYIPVVGTAPSGTGADGVPSAGVSAVIVNVTVLDTTAAGELTIWPYGTAQPYAWNAAWSAGATVSKRLVLDLQGSDALEAYNSTGSTDITLDIDGYYTSGSAGETGSYFTPLPARTICDTAPGNPLDLTGAAAQCNGKKSAGKTLKAHGVLTMAVAGVGGVGVEDAAAPPTAALLEITADDTTASSSLSVYGAKSARPPVPDQSWASGATTENIVFAGLGSGGDVSLYNLAGKVDVVVEVLGYESGAIFLPASTLPLTSSTMSSLTQMTGSSKGVVSLRFSGTPKQISSLVPGDVINSAPTKHAPYGVLERVTSVNHAGGNTIVSAVTPPLSDVLTEGSLAYASGGSNYASSLNSAGPSSRTGAAGQGPRAGYAGGTFSCGGNAGGNVNSNITDFSLTPNVNFSWSPLANFSADVSMRLDLGYTSSMSLTGSFNCNRSFSLIKTTAVGPEAPVDIGPIAFTLTPVAGVSLVLAAIGTASDTTSKTTTGFHEAAGLHFDTSNGFSVYHSSDCDSPVPNGTPGCTVSSSTPSYNVALRLSAGLNFQVAMAVDYVPALNNVVGPYLSVIPAVQVKLQPSAPTVQLNLNLQVQIGLTFQVWVLNLKAFFDLVNDTWTLFHSIYQTSPGNLPSAVATSPYSATLTADGGSTPYTWSLPPDSGAPPWLSLDSDGALSGTPPLSASESSASFNVAVTDASGATTIATYGLSVGPPVSLLTTSLADAVINQQYYAQILAVGGTEPYTFAATGLPTWLTLDSSLGDVSGTVPTTAGGKTYKFTVKVTDSTTPATSASETLSLYVEPFGIAVTSLPEAAVGFPYSTTLYAQNGTTPYTWSTDPKAPLPSWLSLSASDGTLAGTPPASARGTTLHFTLDVTDSSTPALKASAPFSFVVSPWEESVVTSPEGHAYQLGNVSCWSDSGCVAVGSDDNADTGVVSLLAGRYNGSGWSFSDIPAPAGASQPVLSGVSCTSGAFCMAVGSYRLLCPGGQYPESQPIALRWNGTWSIVPKPPEPCSEGAALSSVSCVSASFCMAVGGTDSGQSYVQQWDGRQWFVEPGSDPIEPDVPSNGDGLVTVSCVSVLYCAASGTDQEDYNEINGFISEWNGHAWSLAVAPVVANETYPGLSCTGVESCLAVQLISTMRTTSGWTDVGSAINAEEAVSCVSAADCTAVGRTDVEKWTGAYWEIVGAGMSTVGGISCRDSTHCVAVGDAYAGDSEVPVVETSG